METVFVSRISIQTFCAIVKEQLSLLILLI